MYAFMLIGMTKQGKSRYARKMISEDGQENRGCLVNDVNNEYGEFRRDRDSGVYHPSLNLPTDTNMLRSRYIGPNKKMKPYLNIVRTKTHTNVIFEECTAYFKGRTDDELCEMVINKGHTINNYIFVFHSIRSVPPELLGLMDFVVLFKTSDDEDIVYQKSPKLLPYWLELQTKKDGAPPFVLSWVDHPPFNKKQYLAMKEKYHMI